MNKFLLFIFFILNEMVSHGQIPDYYVYSYVGDISCLRKGAAPQKIQGKYLLYSTDTLSSKQGKVTLVDKDDNFYEVDIKNKLLLSSLNRPTNKNKPLTKKYLHFLWEEFFHKSSNSNEFLRVKLNSIAGEIKTGTDKHCHTERFPPEELVADSRSIPFSWTSFGEEKQYRFSILDRYGNEVHSLVTKDTSLAIDTFVFMRAGMKEFHWNVETSDGRTCPGAYWSFRVADRQQDTKAMYNSSSDSSLLNGLKRIEELDQRKMYLNAVHEYENLLTKYPGDHYLALAYADYLQNFGLKTRAIKILEHRLK